VRAIKNRERARARASRFRLGPRFLMARYYLYTVFVYRGPTGPRLLAEAAISPMILRCRSAIINARPRPSSLFRESPLGNNRTSFSQRSNGNRFSEDRFAEATQRSERARRPGDAEMRAAMRFASRENQITRFPRAAIVSLLYRELPVIVPSAAAPPLFSLPSLINSRSAIRARRSRVSRDKAIK